MMSRTQECGVFIGALGMLTSCGVQGPQRGEVSSKVAVPLEGSLPERSHSDRAPSRNERAFLLGAARLASGILSYKEKRISIGSEEIQNPLRDTRNALACCLESHTPEGIPVQILQECRESLNAFCREIHAGSVSSKTLDDTLASLMATIIVAPEIFPSLKAKTGEVPDSRVI